MPPKGHSESSHSSSSKSHSSHSSSSHNSRPSSSHSSSKNVLSKSSYSYNSSLNSLHSSSTHKHKKEEKHHNTNHDNHNKRNQHPHEHLHSSVNEKPANIIMVNNCYLNNYEKTDTSYEHKDIYSETKEDYKITKNILYRCSYCDKELYLNPESCENPTCPDCGARLNIVSELDEIKSDIEQNNTLDQDKRKSEFYNAMLSMFIIIILLVSTVFLGMFALNKIEEVISINISNEQQTTTSLSDVDIYGSTIYLLNNSDGSYKIITGAEDMIGYDKKLEWNEKYEAYYDPDSDCYLYYNMDVFPYIWQYWFEGYSSDYESGWMEYDTDEECWYIETDPGNWEKLNNWNGSWFWYINME